MDEARAPFSSYQIIKNGSQENQSRASAQLQEDRIEAPKVDAFGFGSSDSSGEQQPAVVENHIIEVAAKEATEELKATEDVKEVVADWEKTSDPIAPRSTISYSGRTQSSIESEGS